MDKKLVVAYCPDEKLESRFTEMICNTCRGYGLQPVFIDNDNEIKRLKKQGIFCLIYISPGKCRKAANLLFSNFRCVKRKLVITSLNHKPVKVAFFNRFGSSVILTDHQSDEDLSCQIEEALDPKLGDKLYQNPFCKVILDFFVSLQSNYLKKFDYIKAILLYMRSINISRDKIGVNQAACRVLYKDDELISIKDAAELSEMYNCIFFKALKNDRLYRSRFPLLAEG